jgi:hypothetical protein
MIKRDFCLKIYWRLQKYLAPGLKYSQDIYEKILDEFCRKNIKWIDLGCGHRNFLPRRFEKKKSWLLSQK